MPNTDLLSAGGAIPQVFPIITLGELDQTEVKLYCNESLVSRIESVEILANTYQVSRVEASDLAEIYREPSYFWPVELRSEEAASRWVRLSIKPDHQNAFERRWIIDFHSRTPRNIL